MSPPRSLESFDGTKHDWLVFLHGGCDFSGLRVEFYPKGIDENTFAFSLPIVTESYLAQF